MRTCIKFSFANKIKAIYERSLVSVKALSRSISRLSSALPILPLFYLVIKILLALTFVAKNASVEISLKVGIIQAEPGNIVSRPPGAIDPPSTSTWTEIALENSCLRYIKPDSFSTFNSSRFERSAK